jgi:hypothetical protein
LLDSGEERAVPKAKARSHLKNNGNRTRLANTIRIRAAATARTRADPPALRKDDKIQRERMSKLRGKGRQDSKGEDDKTQRETVARLRRKTMAKAAAG